jgi:hypothetical protein
MAKVSAFCSSKIEYSHYEKLNAWVDNIQASVKIVVRLVYFLLGLGVAFVIFGPPILRDAKYNYTTRVTYTTVFCSFCALVAILAVIHESQMAKRPKYRDNLLCWVGGFGLVWIAPLVLGLDSHNS